MFLIVLCLIYILQIQNISIGFQDTSVSVKFGICKHELWFTCRSYCRFTLRQVKFWCKFNMQLDVFSTFDSITLWFYISETEDYMNALQMTKKSNKPNIFLKKKNIWCWWDNFCF